MFDVLKSYDLINSGVTCADNRRQTWTRGWRVLACRRVL